MLSGRSSGMVYFGNALGGEARDHNYGSWRRRGGAAVRGSRCEPVRLPLSDAAVK